MSCSAIWGKFQMLKPMDEIMKMDHMNMDHMDLKYGG